MKRILMVLMVMAFIIPMVSATDISFGTFKQGECVSLIQTCSNCSFVNITSIQYPNSTQAIGQASMTKTGTSYNYTFCSTNILGVYIVSGFGDLDTQNEIWDYKFGITSTGDDFSDAQGNMLLAQIGLIGLFLALGFSFSKEKWKLRSFFFIIAIFIGVMLLNSLRVASGGSSTMSSMATSGLIIGIVVLSFIILYTLIFYFKEVFGYFKNKREIRWKSDTSVM